MPENVAMPRRPEPLVSSQFMPLCDVLSWRCHDVIPVPKLLPRALPAQDHLTQLPLAGLAIVVHHGDVDSRKLDLRWLHSASEGFVEYRGTALRFLLGPHPAQYLIPSKCDPDLSLSICKQQQQNNVFLNMISPYFSGQLYIAHLFVYCCHCSNPLLSK